MGHWEANVGYWDQILGALVPKLSGPRAQMGPGPWDMGPGPWNMGPRPWDMGPGTWTLGPGPHVHPPSQKKGNTLINSYWLNCEINK